MKRIRVGILRDETPRPIFSTWRSDVFNAWLMGAKGGAHVCTRKVFTEDAGTLWDRMPDGLAEKVQTHFKGIEYFIDAIQENKPVPVPREEACIT